MAPRFALGSLRSTEPEGVAWGGGHLKPTGTSGRCPTHQPLATGPHARATAGLSSPQANPKFARGSWACCGPGDGTAGGSHAVTTLPSFRKKKGKSKAFLKTSLRFNSSLFKDMQEPKSSSPSACAWMLRKVVIPTSDIMHRCHGNVTNSLPWGCHKLSTVTSPWQTGSKGGSASQPPVSLLISKLAWKMRMKHRIGTQNSFVSMIYWKVFPHEKVPP